MHDLKHWLAEIARPPTRIDADLVLRTAGYRRLNKGAFGAVYQKPGKPYVLKVFSKQDVPYVDFIALTKAYPNPHFPKFFGQVVQVTPQYCAIRMEPLTPYKYDETLIDRYLKYRDFKPKDPNSHFALQRLDAFDWMEEHPEFQAACDLIIDHLLPKHPLDMKQNNLMMRGNTIVITDPVKGADIESEKLPPVEELPDEPAEYNSDDDELLRQLGIQEGWDQYTEIRRIDRNRVMESTTPADNAQLKQRYDHFNQLLFNGHLPDIPITYAKMKTVGGVVNARVRSASTSRWAKKELVPGSLMMKISSVYQRGSQAIDAILIHEMIHVKFISDGEFSENHGSKFIQMAALLGQKVGFVIPLTDDVTGLTLASAPTKTVGIIAIYRKDGRISVAVVSDKYVHENLDALKERWGRINTSLDAIVIMTGTGRIEARYPIQRKKIQDLSFYFLKEEELLSKLQNSKVLATIIPNGQS